MTHLLFADDCFLFCRASLEECNVLKEFLMTYEKDSGQEINFAKLGICFSTNVSIDCKNEIVNILGVSQCLNTGLYLGLLSLVGRSKQPIFNYLRDRL